MPDSDFRLKRRYLRDDFKTISQIARIANRQFQLAVAARGLPEDSSGREDSPEVFFYRHRLQVPPGLTAPPATQWRATMSVAAAS